jgi:hypothetical protein
MKAVARVVDPPGVVTVTDTLPAAWALVTAVIVDPVTTVKDFAVVGPNVTEVAPVKWMPVMVTVVPPVAGPPGGVTPVTFGLVMKVNADPLENGPPAAANATATGPPVWAGVFTVSFVGPVTWTVVPGVPPKVTAAVPVRLVPLIVTTVPPAVGPLVGEIVETVGTVT